MVSQLAPSRYSFPPYIISTRSCPAADHSSILNITHQQPNIIIPLRSTSYTQYHSPKNFYPRFSLLEYHFPTSSSNMEKASFHQTTHLATDQTPANPAMAALAPVFGGSTWTSGFWSCFEGENNLCKSPK